MKVTCVVDNAVRLGSSFWGEHGLAFLIEMEGYRVLFDTGQHATVLLHNFEIFNMNSKTIDALAISHNHYDHTGGLAGVVDQVRPGIPLYANLDLFRERYSRREGELKKISTFQSEQDLTAQLTLELSQTPQEILPNLWTTGEIVERMEPEGRSDHHFIREDDVLVPDPYKDDLALVLEVGEGLLLLCGCCHAGLLNTLAHVQRTFGEPIVGIAGGLHLTGASDDELQHVVEILSSLPALKRVYPNHCTGEVAFVALTQGLGAQVIRPCPAGTILEI
jgi:7,8-dihydropterin-6-yl-methyl-4-(beta-D-ribofuranosyl)aminobenzene 5'-phosphate synthase